MQPTNEAVVNAVIQALTTGRSAWLATVMQTWGSSPRPVGSLMCWAEGTGVVGSISGGCIEEYVLAAIQAGELNADTPCVLSYGGQDGGAGASAEGGASGKASHFELPCGGELKICVEAIEKNADVMPWLNMLQSLTARKGGVRQLNIQTGEWLWYESPPQHCVFDGLVFKNYLGPIRKLLIVGAGPITDYLVDFASAMDYTITVCDPSDDLPESWRERKDIQFTQHYPDGFVARDFGDSRSAVVAVSHDPRIDDMALLEALPSEAFYIGAMGSLKTSQARRARLQSLGVSPAMLEKLHAPIGVDIGSKTPAEIALSICAHLIKHHGH